MKRFLVLFMIMGLVVGSVTTAEAGKKKKKAPKKAERTVEGTYTSTGVIAVGFCSQTDAVNCVEIPSGANESFLTAKVTDAHGLPVPVAVKADLDGDNSSETLYGTFCGETEEPIQIDPGAAIIFWIGISSNTAAMGCPPATTGSIEVTFSNLP
ncbi:MAG TPA: hypothetical protein VG929_08865 [Actinomycetota bacterium]|nr:hypothetical protein [Actinomycetota bacterium]